LNKIGIFSCVAAYYESDIWPVATNIVALHPHQTKRKPTAVPSLLFIQEWAQPPRNIFSIYKTTAAKRSPWDLSSFGIRL
tara:strand:- start:25223 stop:25462 length:240 start_codon:yes stop_codon:yes gene_type:complete